MKLCIVDVRSAFGPIGGGPVQSNGGRIAANPVHPRRPRVCTQADWHRRLGRDRWIFALGLNELVLQSQIDAKDAQEADEAGCVDERGLLQEDAF